MNTPATPTQLPPPQGFLSFFPQELLPIEQLPVAKDTTLHVNGNGQFTLHPWHWFHTIVSFGKWLQAWNRYKWIVMSENYILYHGLVTYQELIQNYNKEFYWESMCKHINKQFRAHLALTQAFNFGTIDNDLYTTILCIIISLDVIFANLLSTG